MFIFVVHIQCLHVGYVVRESRISRLVRLPKNDGFLRSELPSPAFRVVVVVPTRLGPR